MRILFIRFVAFLFERSKVISIGNLAKLISGDTLQIYTWSNILLSNVSFAH